MEGGHGSSYYFCVSSLPYTINPFLMCCPIKAGLYSATLTAFIVESRKKLMPDPSDEIVYYAQQSVTLLVDLLQRVLPAKGGPSSDQVPEYIIDRFLTFLEGVLESRKRSHVGDPYHGLKIIVNVLTGINAVSGWKEFWLIFFNACYHQLKVVRPQDNSHKKLSIVS